MRFELERVESDEVYTCRVYKDDSPSYFGICTLKKNPDGLVEPHAWLTRKREIELLYYKEALPFFWSKGFELAFTFEKSKFHLYERMLRSVCRLEVIREFTKKYNEQGIEFCYGRMVKNV